MGNSCVSESASNPVTASTAAADFIIFVTTSDKRGAGTNADVFIALYNAQGNRSRDIKLDAKQKHNFEAGKTDRFLVEDLHNFGEVKKIEIWRSGGLDDWFVKSIEVEDVAAKKTVHFPVHGWVKAETKVVVESQQQVGGGKKRPAKVGGKKRPAKVGDKKSPTKDLHLRAGMTGILLTCTARVQPGKEALNLLCGYADEMYGPEKEEEKIKEDGEASIKNLRKTKQGRFQIVDYTKKHKAFIKTKIDPCELVHHILTDIQQTKTKKTSHIMRMVPIATTCRTDLVDIEQQAPSILKPHFKREDGQVFSYRVVFKERKVSKVKSNSVITTFDRLVTDMGKHTVDLKNPDKVILVEVMRDICCLSVLTDFFKLKRYNLKVITDEFTNENN